MLCNKHTQIFAPPWTMQTVLHKNSVDGAALVEIIQLEDIVTIKQLNHVALCIKMTVMTPSCVITITLPVACQCMDVSMLETPVVVHKVLLVVLQDTALLVVVMVNLVALPTRFTLLVAIQTLDAVGLLIQRECGVAQKALSVCMMEHNVVKCSIRVY